MTGSDERLHDLADTVGGGVPLVRLEVSANSHHSHQVVSGFILLARHGEVDLKIAWSEHNNRLPSTAWVLAEIDGRPIAFDTDDGDILPAQTVDAFGEDVDLIFRRSLPLSPPGFYASEPKHRALGLNYHATLRDKYFFKAALRSNSGIRALGAAMIVERDRADRFKLRRPDVDDGTVLFQARLWDPPAGGATTDPRERFRSEDRSSINADRIALVRHLRDAFGDRFIGGLAPTNYAKQVAPDLVMSSRQASQSSFLRAARNARICVTSRGLWRSNGWKLAEFFAQGNAVVCETLLHHAPALHAGTHYDEFDSPGSVVSVVKNLYDDSARLQEMRLNARRYFEHHVEPAAVARTALHTVTADAP